ncbi:MAG: alkaline phosphatase D family protein [Myxococcota bacterium]
MSLVYAVFLIVYRLTGFKQRAPLLPNPYKKLNEVLEKGLSNVADERVPSGPPPEFMIHAGDQIYFDFPFPQRAPTEAAYRLAYKEAWFEDDQFRRFLSQCPQYMTLDDHEIVDGFATDGVVPKGRDPYEYLEPATQAYREYVNSRHPTADDSLFYKFDHGTTRFFVMDTRTQRSDHSGEMIDPKQMCRFKEWLITYKDDLKFVVSSVAFVAEVKSKKNANRKRDERDDKWSGRPFRAQREEIIEFLHENRIERVVFLVGDMHCCYHASMRIGWPHDRTTVHELAGGPIYQLQFGSRDEFLDEHRGVLGADGKLPVRTSLQQFHGAASGVLYVNVRPEPSPEVRWQVVRTSPDLKETFKPRPLSGRIRFEEHHHS